MNIYLFPSPAAKATAAPSDATLLGALAAPMQKAPPCGRRPNAEWNAVCRAFAALRLDPCEDLRRRLANQFLRYLETLDLDSHRRAGLLAEARRRIAAAHGDAAS